MGTAGRAKFSPQKTDLCLHDPVTTLLPSSQNWMPGRAVENVIAETLTGPEFRSIPAAIESFGRLAEAEPAKLSLRSSVGTRRASLAKGRTRGRFVIPFAPYGASEPPMNSERFTTTCLYSVLHFSPTLRSVHSIIDRFDLVQFYFRTPIVRFGEKNPLLPRHSAGRLRGLLAWSQRIWLKKKGGCGGIELLPTGASTHGETGHLKCGTAGLCAGPSGKKLAAVGIHRL